jgi:peptide/nickel transport system substrate-binding protein
MFSLALAAAPAVTPAYAGGNLVAGARSGNRHARSAFYAGLYLAHLRIHGVRHPVAKDSKGEIKPQMVQDWKVSPDGLIYTFTLRDGLKWHDGQPVTSRTASHRCDAGANATRSAGESFAVTASLEPMTPRLSC